jgi:methylated-DNA-[protein]-cysteine S-methyltransferase
MTTLMAPALTTRRVDSPFGQLTIVGSPAGLRAILWPGDDPARVGLAGVALHADSIDVLDETVDQLDEYFSGNRTGFNLPLDLHGTPFQLATWRALAEIPYGETRTYAEQAARLGCPKATRAVGTANGRNPLSIVLPCHRIVGSDGALHGFAGGLAAKAALLAFEQLRSGQGDRLRSVTLLPWPSPVALGGEAAVP